MMNMLVGGVVGTCRRDVDAVVGRVLGGIGRCWAGIGREMVRSGCKRDGRLMVAWLVGWLLAGLVACVVGG